MRCLTSERSRYSDQMSMMFTMRFRKMEKKQTHNHNDNDQLKQTPRCSSSCDNNRQTLVFLWVYLIIIHQAKLRPNVKKTASTELFPTEKSSHLKKNWTYQTYLSITPTSRIKPSFTSISLGEPLWIIRFKTTSTTQAINLKMSPGHVSTSWALPNIDPERHSPYVTPGGQRPWKMVRTAEATARHHPKFRWNLRGKTSTWKRGLHFNPNKKHPNKKQSYNLLYKIKWEI